jgi:uncharacterized protein DUF4232
MNGKTIGHRVATFLLAAASLTALVVAFVATGSAAAPVAWVDQSGTPLAAAAVHAQRACRAADLQIAAGRAGAFQGFATQELVLTNRASDACALAGPPSGSAILDAGGSRSLTAARSAAHRIDLAPGQTARALIGAPGACAGAGHPSVASSLSLELDTGETAAVSGVWVNVECGAPQTILFNAGAVPVQRVPASGLEATLSAPASTARGKTLSYVVILSNPTSTAISFGACPSYTESLGTARTLVSRTLRLNCGGAARLAPGQSLAFEMRLGVPQAMTAGTAKLGWHLEVPDGAAAGTAISVG